MKRAYKYKIKPTNKQREQLSQTFGCARFIYNWGLNRKISSWTEKKESLTYLSLAREVTLLKKEKEYEWLNEVPAECLQQSLRNLDNAYTQFFKAKKGFPKFKSKKKSKDVAKYICNVQVDFANWRVKIAKCGWVKLCHNKPFDVNTVKIGTLTVSKDKCGDYWCVIIVEDGQSSIPKAKVLEETSVGVDLGIKDFATLSDGAKFGNPKYYENSQKKLKRLQQKFARTKNGSKRHETYRLKVAKQYRKVSNKRMDFLHKLSTYLVKQYSTICLENLNIDGMLKNHHLAKCIQSASWSEFVRQLSYKCEWYGKNIIFIGRFEPSSKACSCCGYINAELKLSDREWTCPRCGKHHDRDVNAAVNIKNLALNPQSLVAHEEKCSEITAHR